MTSKTETVNGVSKGTTSYTYDVLNRLKTVTEPNGRVTVYTFDASGNRQTETITFEGNTTVNTYTYNEQNRLMGITTKVNNVIIKVSEYTYDANGNQLTITKTPYTNGVAGDAEVVAVNEYDKLNQLTKTIAGDIVVENRYNGEGLRVEKTVDGNTTRYLYEHNKVVLEVDGDTGQQTARNIYGINLLIREVGTESYYYMYNGHADVTALINTATGTVDATYYYDAFGNIIESTGDVNNNITYAGYQYDEETGLYYLNARMYDPKIARFLQEDTYRGNINDPLSLNLYVYCFQNPLIYWDPTGHEGEPIAYARIRHITSEDGRIINGRTYVALRDIAEAFGSSEDVSYKEETDRNIATFYINGNLFEIITDKLTGKRTFSINNEIANDIDVRLIDGRNLIPLRSVANVLGVDDSDISWYRDTNGIIVAHVEPRGIWAMDYDPNRPESRDINPREFLKIAANNAVGVEDFYIIDNAGFLSVNTENNKKAISATAELLISKAMMSNDIEFMVSYSEKHGKMMTNGVFFGYPDKEPDDYSDTYDSYYVPDYDSPIIKRHAMIGFTPKIKDDLSKLHMMFIHELTHAMDWIYGIEEIYRLDTRENIYNPKIGSYTSELRYFTEATAIWVENSVKLEFGKTDFRYDGSSRLRFGEGPGGDTYGKFPESYILPRNAIEYINLTYK